MFSPHQQQHFIINRNQKCNFDFKTIFLAFLIEPCDLLNMATWTTEHHLWPSRWEGKLDLNWLVKTSYQWYSAVGDFLSSLNVLLPCLACCTQCLPLHCIRELKQRRFWATHINWKWTFCIIGEWCCPNSQVNGLLKSEDMAMQIWWLQSRLVGKSLAIGCLIALLKNAFA